MVYYLTNISDDNLIVDERNAIFFTEAGTRRSEYVLSTMNGKVEVVSLAIPRNKGYFKHKKQDINSNLSYYYPFSLNYAKLKYISIMLSILWHLLVEVKEDDIIVGYNANIMYVLPIMVCKLLKRNKLVYEIEELYSNTTLINGIKHKIMKFTEDLMLKYSDMYIIVSEKTKERINNVRPTILNFGYSMNDSNIEAVLSEEKVIVYSGRFDYEGGIEIFIDSLELIRQKVKVIITGSGILKEKIERRKVINDNVQVHFLGFVEDVTLNRIMNNATVCVNPLRLSNPFSNYSFPSKVLMYLSYGVNVVSSISNGILPLVDKFNNLYTYEEDTAVALAEKIEEALSIKTNKKENLKRIKLFFENQRQELSDFWNLI